MNKMIKALRRPCIFQTIALAVIAALLLAWLESCQEAHAAPLVERAGGPHATLMDLAVQPARGQATVQPETLAVIRRLTDVTLTTSPLSPNPKAWNGNPKAGITPGYSRKHGVNASGEYLLGCLTTPGMYLIRLSDFKPVRMVTTRSGYKIGYDQNDVSWRNEKDRANWIVYAVGSGVYEQDAVAGASTERLICSLGEPFQTTADGDIDASGRYKSFATKSFKIRVVDLWERRLLPGYAVQDTAGVDVAPRGDCVRGNKTFWPMRMFVEGTTATASGGIQTPGGHGGFCQNAAGETRFVQQNNLDDWLTAVDPKTGAKTRLMKMAEIGSGNVGIGIHVAGDRLMACNGWALISVYGGGGVFANNIFFVEIKANPRMIRVCNGQQRYFNGYYQTEMWSSLAPDGKSVLWGGNWDGADNIEAYRSELPADVSAYLANPPCEGP